MSSLVLTQSGTVEGTAREMHHAFLGIPYAKPPVGPLRFRAPQPPTPWQGTRPAQSYGASPIQGAMFAPGVLAEGPQSEDCLFVNVFTPRADSVRRPVLFWIHGGAFTAGSAGTALYDGGRLAEIHDVVVVTCNYRLGALGYLAFGKDGERWGAVDNRGQLDQLAALTWTRENIAAFGGDPENITIFGESAGGTAVCLLLATPHARGLFRRAIVQSGTGPLVLPTADFHAPARAEMAQTLDLDERALERLNDVPIAALQAAQAQFEDKSPFPFYPMFDGALYPQQPIDLLRSGQGSSVPLVLGTNRDEWNLFAAMSLGDFALPLPEPELVDLVMSRMPEPSREKAERMIGVYRASRLAANLPHDNRALLRAIDGDRRFRIPSIRFIEAYAARAPSYLYQFVYPSPALGGVLGACHALELGFVFESYDAPGQASFVGTGEPVTRLSRTISTLWTSFARNDRPTAPGVPAWPAFDVARRATLQLGQETKVVDDPLGDEREAWDDVL